MIVRDEEHSLDTVLSGSRPYVEQIVVVDTGSKDKTLEIASQYADVIEHFTWIEDFSAARNFSLRFADQPWILVLDADEFIDEENFNLIRSRISSANEFDGYYLWQHLYSDNIDGSEPSWKPASKGAIHNRGKRGYSENKIVRLFKNNKGINYCGRIHEIVDESIAENALSDSGAIIHHHHDDPKNQTRKHVLRNLEIQEALIKNENATARDFLSAGAGHLRTTQDFDRAAGYFKSALSMGAPPDDTIEAIAETAYRAGRLEEAYHLYRQLYESGAGSSAVLNNLSNLLVKTGDLNGAAALLQELLDRGVDDDVRKARIEQNLVVLREAINERE